MLNQEVAGVELTEEQTGFMSPAKCRVFLRRRIAEEFKEITKGFLEVARTGSCQHLKLATELLGPTRKDRRTPRQTVGIVYEKIRKEAEARRLKMAAGEAESTLRG